mgnify:CR=1 FL=1
MIGVLMLIFYSGYVTWRMWEGNRTVAVPDGDSLDLADGRRIRLLALDAPERGRCMADEAKSGLTTLVLGKHVRLKNTVKDSFGRTLAIVIVEEPHFWLQYLQWRLVKALIGSQIPMPDPLMNRVMISRGWARLESAPKPYAGTLKAASQMAKDNKLGIWSETCRSAKPSTSASRPGLEAEACSIKGNLRAGEKHYYLPTCKEYNQVIVDLSYGDAWFCSARDAEAVSFTKAPVCR